MTAGATPIPRSAAIVNLGCKVNQSEMEGAARLLREAGVPLVDPGRGADLVLVNTCTVTATADEKSRAAVRRARRANPGAEIVVTGCSVQVGPEAFAAVDPDARLVGNDGKAALLAELEALLVADGDADAARPTREDGTMTRPLPTLSGVDVVAAPIDGIADDRASVERTRAFVKVQDGCSFYCTYCIIPRARGAERSLAPAAVLADVRRALAAGHREIVLTGINIGTYDGGWSERGHRGSHTRSALTLAGLVRRILAETGVERIRLSSIEPQHVDDDLLEAWVEGAPRTLPHLHLPLQSGDDGVLRRMGRRYLTADYARVVDRARRAIPGVAVHADVIAGFPTEDAGSVRPDPGLRPGHGPRGPPRVPVLGPPGDAGDADGGPGGRADEEGARGRAAGAGRGRALPVRARGTRDGDPRPGGVDGCPTAAGWATPRITSWSRWPGAPRAATTSRTRSSRSAGRPSTARSRTA